jgi:hypothetical protein
MAMASRSRLLALCFAVLCTVGWVHASSPRLGGQEGDRVTAGDGVGVLPGRRDSVAGVQLDAADDDDDPACWVPRSGGAHGDHGRAVLRPIVPRDEPIAARLRGPARQRGPPSIA